LVQIRPQSFSYRGDRHTHTQTDTQTNGGKTYSLAFARRMTDTWSSDDRLVDC